MKKIILAFFLATLAQAAEIRISETRAKELKIPTTLVFDDCTIQKTTVNGVETLATTPITGGKFEKFSPEDIIQKICNEQLFNHYSYNDIKKAFHQDSLQFKYLFPTEQAYNTIKSSKDIGKTAIFVELITQKTTEKVTQYLCKETRDRETWYCIHVFDNKTGQYLRCNAEVILNKELGDKNINTLLNVLQWDVAQNKNSIISINPTGSGQKSQVLTRGDQKNIKRQS